MIRPKVNMIQSNLHAVLKRIKVLDGVPQPMVNFRMIGLSLLGSIHLNIKSVYQTKGHFDTYEAMMSPASPKSHLFRSKISWNITKLEFYCF